MSGYLIRSRLETIVLFPIRHLKTCPGGNGTGELGDRNYGLWGTVLSIQPYLI